VVAGQLLDRLNQMQNVTATSRPAQSYATNWGNDIKVEIPDTGISVGEFQRFLKQWLGHDTRISGAVWHTPTGISIAARSGTKVAEPINGSEADFDNLIQQAAEQVYGATQPYRYANYLDRNIYRSGAVLRIAEAEAIYRRLIYDPDPTERAWAWNGLGTQAYSHYGNIPEAVRDYHKALEVQPGLAIAYSALTFQEVALSHPEAALAAARQYQRLEEIESPTQRSRDSATLSVANLVGDYAEGARLCAKISGQPNALTVLNHDIYQDCAALALAGQHDGAATRAWIADMPPVEAPRNNGQRALARLRTAAALQDWRTVAATEAAEEKAWITWLPDWDRNVTFNRDMRPLLALARAMLGDIAGGGALIASLPGDCYDCIRIHATIAAMAGKTEQADALFENAVRAAPSIPFAYTDWGQVLLARRKPDEAIAKFTLANQKGPHFADPLEGWGQALMAKNQSHLALAKFAEAEKYAPNWGRLHLKWGEALLYAGKAADAKAQLARAAGLDLTRSDRRELASIHV
jgi:tetratricopeptide (TPR) repeat protein